MPVRAAIPFMAGLALAPLAPSVEASTGPRDASTLAATREAVPTVRVLRMVYDRANGVAIGSLEVHSVGGYEIAYNNTPYYIALDWEIRRPGDHAVIFEGSSNLRPHGRLILNNAVMPGTAAVTRATPSPD